MINALLIKPLAIEQILSGDKIWVLTSHKFNIASRLYLIDADTDKIVGNVMVDGYWDSIKTRGSAALRSSLHLVSDISLTSGMPHPIVISSAHRHADLSTYYDGGDLFRCVDAI